MVPGELVTHTTSAAGYIYIFPIMNDLVALSDPVVFSQRQVAASEAAGKFEAFGKKSNFFQLVLQIISHLKMV